MQTFKFEKKQLNFSQKWCASVSVESEHVTSESLVARMMCQYGYTRKELRELVDCLKTEIMDELMKGNSVDLLGFVRLRPDYSIKGNCVGDECDAERNVGRLTAKDVKTSLRANINQSFNHEYVRLYHKKSLESSF